MTGITSGFGAAAGSDADSRSIDAKGRGRHSCNKGSRPAASGFIEVLILLSVAILAVLMIHTWFAAHENQMREMRCVVWMDIHQIYDQSNYWGKIAMQNTGHVIIQEYRIMHGDITMASTRTLPGNFTLADGVTADIEPSQKTILEFSYNGSDGTLLPAAVRFSADMLTVQGVSAGSSTFCHLGAL